MPDDLTHQYGICGVGKRLAKNMFEVDGMVEKPPKGTAPSNLSITGRYILQPEIFKILETQERGAGNEIQLTDAMKTLARTQSFYGVEFEGERHDCGSKVRLPARQHRLRHGARRPSRRLARGDEEVSGEVKRERRRYRRHCGGDSDEAIPAASAWFASLARNDETGATKRIHR